MNTSAYKTFCLTVVDVGQTVASGEGLTDWLLLSVHVYVRIAVVLTSVPHYIASSIITKLHHQCRVKVQLNKYLEPTVVFKILHFCLPPSLFWTQTCLLFMFFSCKQLMTRKLNQVASQWEYQITNPTEDWKHMLYYLYHLDICLPVVFSHDCDVARQTRMCLKRLSLKCNVCNIAELYTLTRTHT